MVDKNAVLQQHNVMLYVTNTFLNSLKTIIKIKV